MNIDIAEAENLVVNSIISNALAFNEAVDVLVNCLLSELKGMSVRPTDGVHFHHQTLSPKRATGVAVLVWIAGQTVDPMRVDIHLDALSTRMTDASIHIGDSNRHRVPFDSKEHRRIEKELILDHGRMYDWKFVFQRRTDEWVCRD